MRFFLKNLKKYALILPQFLSKKVPHSLSQKIPEKRQENLPMKSFLSAIFFRRLNTVNKNLQSA
ncbi:MAG: hypothetical protein K0S12_1085 [Bacteroidetes bacterium]|jgi:hypothetical protein|nr:hypothetical protein [Bacteroidota bacterium]